MNVETKAAGETFMTLGSRPLQAATPALEQKPIPGLRYEKPDKWIIRGRNKDILQYDHAPTTDDLLVTLIVLVHDLVRNTAK